MADIVSELAGKCGISAESAQKGLGAVLGFLKDKLPAEAFAKISAAVPGADGMVAAADSGESAGVMGAITGAVGKLFGGNAGDVLARVGQTGMTPGQLQDLIPKVMEFLRGKLPASVMDQISRLLPVPQEAAQ